MSFLYCDTQPAVSAGGEAAQHKAERTTPLPPPLLVAVLGLVHPRVWLALWAAVAHCWLMFNLLLTKPPLSRGLLSSLLSSSLYI